MSSSHLEALTAQALDNGDAIKDMNEMIVKACHDVIDRSYLEKPRKVQFVITIIPNATFNKDTGEIQSKNPKINYVISMSLPTNTGTETVGIVNGRSVLVNQEFKDEPDQPPLPGFSNKASEVLHKLDEAVSNIGPDTTLIFSTNQGEQS